MESIVIFLWREEKNSQLDGRNSAGVSSWDLFGLIQSQCELYLLSHYCALSVYDIFDVVCVIMV